MNFAKCLSFGSACTLFLGAGLACSDSSGEERTDPVILPVVAHRIAGPEAGVRTELPTTLIEGFELEVQPLAYEDFASYFPIERRPLKQAYLVELKAVGENQDIKVTDPYKLGFRAPLTAVSERVHCLVITDYQGETEKVTVIDQVAVQKTNSLLQVSFESKLTKAIYIPFEQLFVVEAAPGIVLNRRHLQTRSLLSLNLSASYFTAEDLISFTNTTQSQVILDQELNQGSYQWHASKELKMTYGGNDFVLQALNESNEVIDESFALVLKDFAWFGLTSLGPAVEDGVSFPGFEGAVGTFASPRVTNEVGALITGDLLVTH